MGVLVVGKNISASKPTFLRNDYDKMSKTSLYIRFSRDLIIDDYSLIFTQIRRDHKDPCPGYLDLVALCYDVMFSCSQCVCVSIIYNLS